MIKIIFLVLIPALLIAQIKPLDIQNYADCNDRLQLEVRRTIGPTNNPVGYGNYLEFEGNQLGDTLFMQKESHSVWYEFRPKAKGDLLIEIEPIDSLDDYDFSIYEYTDSNFCKDVYSKKLKPVRTNFSRNIIALKGKTGLSMQASNARVAAGVQAAYSKSLTVQKEKSYILFLNNVYDHGSGHYLHFDYAIRLNLQGNVQEIGSQQSIQASISLTDIESGNILAQTTSDSLTGDYQLDFVCTKSRMNSPLQLEVFKDGYVFKDTLLTAFKIATEMRGIRLKSRIKKLQKGARFVVSNIIFHGNSPQPLQRSLPSLKSLFKTMKRNKNLKITIEGHTNGCNNGIDYSQRLSDARAQTVYNFLVEHQIDLQRLQFKGFGCQHMLHSVGGPMQHLNRRVEIEIIEL